MTNSSIRPSALVTFSVGIQTPGEPTLLMSGRVFPSVKIASPCSFTGSFIAYFTGSIRLRHCRLNALDQSREARWNVLQTRVRRERHGRRRSCNSSSFNEKQWCPGWESNPHEEKSPEDFKFHSHEESTTYTKLDEYRRIATSVDPSVC